MRCNMGDLEKTVRGMMALMVIAYGHYFRHYSERWSEIIFWGGMYVAFTAVFAWCPVRRLFGIPSVVDVNLQSAAPKV